MASKSQFDRPELVRSAGALQQVLAAWRAQHKSIGFVPTMGALHDGHLSLVKASRAECDVAVASIFVNPTQFGPRDDFGKYPRNLARDLDLLGGSGVEIVFAPSAEDMYPPGYATYVDVSHVSEPLEGHFRPGHFRGVTTVVLKLFNLVQPDVAYFGQKDYQQTLVIRRMCDDLNLRVQLRICPTVREPDGLALSSRNAYLSAAERQRSLAIWRALSLARQLVGDGARDARSISQRMRDVLTTAGITEIDYAAIANPDTLTEVDTISGPVVALIAAKVGSTRLIDNEILTPAAY